MKTLETDLEIDVRSRLIGLECWYANAGGKHVGSAFSLAFGARIPRNKPLTNTAHPEEYRNYEGEANLLVWCTWRLDGQDRPESSSDDADDSIQSAIQGLVGARIVDVDLERPGWDLRLLFHPFRRLHVFCDHVPGDPSFDGNWELHTPDRSLFFGPGADVEVASR